MKVLSEQKKKTDTIYIFSPRDAKIGNIHFTLEIFRNSICRKSCALFKLNICLENVIKFMFQN